MALAKHSVTTMGCSARKWAGLRAAALVLLLGGAFGLPGIATAQAPPSLSGKWQLSCSGRRGRARQITLRITQSGSKLSGSFTGPRRSGNFSGTVQGGQVSLQIGGDDRSITLTGTTNGSSMTVDGPKGASCSASRQ
jgi:hypothetical protein